MMSKVSMIAICRYSWLSTRSTHANVYNHYVCVEVILPPNKIPLSKNTCENLKLLEVVMEHLLFHWEDIVDVLLDELLT